VPDRLSKTLQRGKARAQYIYRQISEQLRKDIQEQKYPPLSRLPSMDVLALRYEVNKITIRKALSELRVEGLVYSVPAQGTFVSDPNAIQSARAKPQLLTIGLLGHVLMKSGFGPYHLEIISGIQAELSRNNSSLVILPAGEVHRQEDYLALVRQAHLDAVIYLGQIPKPILQHLIRHGPPAVIADMVAPPANADVIYFDNRAGAEVAATHLVELGHRNIALLTGPSDQAAILQRDEAARAVWAARGIPLSSIRNLHGDFTRDSGRKAAEQLLKSGVMPSAIFALNDEMAIGLMEALRADGRYRVPQDISIIGFDDIFWAASCVPALTTVRVDKGLLGRMAVQRILDRIQEPSLAASSTQVEPQLVLRNSAGPGPVGITGPDILHSA
jgi:DNA-binding LacI/PurR family transcriptional regulator